MMNFGATLSLCLIVIITRFTNATKIKACEYSSWGLTIEEPWKYTPEHYEAGLCTHIFYAYDVIENSAIVEPYDREYLVGYNDMLLLKKKQPDLKIFLTWQYSWSNKQNYASKKNRSIFISSVVEMIHEFKFDGFNFDVQFANTLSKENFVDTLKELRSTFDNEILTPLLSVTLSGFSDYFENYDPQVINQTADFVIMWTTEFHTPDWDEKIGFSSPLNSKRDSYSIKPAVNHWIEAGLPKEKMIVTLPTYGRGYVLKDPTENTPGISHHSGGIKQTNFIKNEGEGVVSYYEICMLLEDKNSTWTQMYDETAATPYMFNKTIWYTYENKKSLTAKLKWIKSENLGGAFMVSLHYDDFLKHCKSSKRRHPLIRLMNEVLDV